jgi:hypothetical protein
VDWWHPFHGGMQFVFDTPILKTSDCQLVVMVVPVVTATLSGGGLIMIAQQMTLHSAILRPLE